jgi:hypothetical protein
MRPEPRVISLSTHRYPVLAHISNDTSRPRLNVTHGRNFRWRETKLRATDIHSIIAAFEHGRSDRVLSLVGDAIRLSAPIVATDASQLGLRPLVAPLGPSCLPQRIGYRRNVSIIAASAAGCCCRLG